MPKVFLILILLHSHRLKSAMLLPLIKNIKEANIICFLYLISKYPSLHFTIPLSLYRYYIGYSDNVNLFFCLEAPDRERRKTLAGLGLILFTLIF